MQILGHMLLAARGDPQRRWLWTRTRSHRWAGIRLFAGEGDWRVDLERISLGEADQLTDLRLRVVK